MTSKLTLSKEEFDLVQNAEWFLIKQRVVRKVYELFGLVLEDLKGFLCKKQDFEQIVEKSPKIFKGENYHGLPWVMMDYPRKFSANDVFAIRTMFWWGNYFSITLHVKGEYKKKLLRHADFSLHVMQKESFYVCVNENEWEHHLEKDNYLPADKILQEDFDNLLQERSFLKIAKMIPLTEWDNAILKMNTVYREMLRFF